MANDLTGDFDVVAEFAIPAANRVLAAMHTAERFLHSVSLRVDDTSPIRDGIVAPPASVLASVDEFGDPLTNHDQLVGAVTFPSFAGSGVVASALDTIANFETVGVTLVPIEPSLLKGRAQLQVFPPTVAVPDASGKRLTVKMQFLARYFPDANTAPLAEFIHGELQMTAAVSQVASQVGRILEIDLKSNEVSIGFTPIFSSRPLSANDVAGIKLLIRNALKTSFLPSTTTLPANIAHVQAKTLAGGQGALALMLNMTGGAGNPSTVHNVFLSGGDHFAFAAGADFVRAAFQPTLDNILGQTFPPVSFDVDTLVHTFHITYTVKLNSATVTLDTGAIVLRIKGHAHTGTSWMPDFDFTITQKFTLSPDGATANLVVGDLSFDTSSWVVDRFKGAATGDIERMRDRALNQSGALSLVRNKLSADKNLGDFLKSLFEGPRKAGTPPPPPGFSLAYTSIDILQSGIVLHGSVAVPEFPAAHIEFEQIPTASGPVGNSVFSEPNYTALKAWIPGGTIERFEWNRHGSVQAETHKFIFDPEPVLTTGGANPSHLVAGYHPLCLTIRGSRLSASGPIVAQPVSATTCGFTSFPVFGTAGELAPLVALTHAGPRGLVEIAGHAPVRQDPSGAFAPNLIVHFADDRSVGRLDVLAEGLRASGRNDAATAILAILAPDQFAHARFADGVSFADDQGGAWERLLGVDVARRPLTVIAIGKRGVVWRHEGEIDAPTLADALRKNLVARRPIQRGVVTPGVRIGHPPPNLLFSHAPGREATLRKIVGQPAVLVFWKGASKASIDAVREVQKTASAHRERPPVVLAINDGDPVELAQKLSAGHGFDANLVLDPKRSIARAYGVSIWPTIVYVDARGLVTHVNAGRDRAAADAGAQVY